MNEIIINDEKFSGLRLDVFLSNILEISRNQALNLIQNCCVSVNENIAKKPSFKLSLNDKILVKFIQKEPLKSEFELDFDIPIIYEDDDLLVLNKPANLIVHPAASVKEPTLVDWLTQKGFLLSTLSGQSRAGIVHRLDRGTSGAIVVAKNNSTHAFLSAQLSDKSMGRIYLAITDLSLKQNCIVNRPIGRNPSNRLKKAIVSSGREAKSAFANLLISDDINKQKANINLIASKLFTGRTHQIRVHLSSINRHILGDTLYGFKSENDRIKRVMLHAFGIFFTHPKTKQKMTFTAPVWGDFMEILNLNFSKEMIDEKIDFTGINAMFSGCDEWVLFT